MSHIVLHKQRHYYTLLFLFVVMILASAACDRALPSVPETEPAEVATITITPQRTSTRPAPTSAPAETPTPSSSLEVDPAKLQGLTLQIWHAWDGPAGETIQELIEQYNQQNEWGLQVTPVYQDGYDGLFEQVNASLEEGLPPDLAVGYLHHALAWDANDQVVDLRAFTEDPVWGWKPAGQVDFYPVFWEQDLVGEKRLGVPAQRSGQLLFYNATWARSLGFEAAPRSPEEFAEQACAAARANQQDADPQNDGTGGLIISTDYPAVLGWLLAFDAQLVQGNPDAGRAGYQFDTPEVDEAFTFLRGLYDDGCAWLAESALPYDDFAARRALFAVGNVIDIPLQMEAIQQAGGRDRWTVIPFPSPVSRPAFSIYGPSYQVFFTTSERQLASWLLIKWLSSPENQARLVKATGGFPLRASALSFMGDYGKRYPQWLEAVEELTASAQSEPKLASWRLVRWTLNDAATQLFRSYFSIEQVPELLGYWDATAAELHRGLPEQ